MRRYIIKKTKRLICLLAAFLLALTACPWGALAESGLESAEIEETATESESAPYENEICGMLWLDTFEDVSCGIRFGDGVRQPQEEPLTEYPVCLFYADDLSIPLNRAITDAFGEYRFANLVPGEYIVGISAETAHGIEYYPTRDGQKYFSERITVNADTAVSGVNAGIFNVKNEPAEEKAPVEEEDSTSSSYNNSVGGTVWLDADGDGEIGETESLLPGAELLMYGISDTESPVAATQSGSDGTYVFGDVEPGVYVISARDMSGLSSSEIVWTDEIAAYADSRAVGVNIDFAGNDELQPEIAAALVVIPLDESACVVYTPSDFENALKNTAYTTIYFGADISLDKRVVIAQRESLTICGMNPLESGQTIPYTYTDSYGNRAGGLQSNVAMAMDTGKYTPNITFKQINLMGYNIYGFVTASYTTCNINIVFDEVTGSAYEFISLFDSTLTIRNSSLTVDKIGTYAYSEEVAEVKNLIFEGTVVINHRSTVGTPYSVFNFNNYGSGTATITVREGANVTINKNSASDLYGCFYFYAPTNNFTAEKNSSFTYNGVDRFLNLNKDYSDFTVKEGAEVLLNWSKTGSGGSPRGISASTVTVEKGGSLSVTGSINTYATIQAASIKLNSPKYFLSVNSGSGSAISSNSGFTASLSATGLESIYYYGTVSSFMGKVPARSFFQENGTFGISAANWGTSNPTGITSGYQPGYGAAALTAQNISASGMKAVEIGGATYLLTYDGGGAETGTVPAGGRYGYNALVTVSDGSGLERNGFSFVGWNSSPDGDGMSYPAGSAFRITKDTVLYAQWLQRILTVTEKFVDEQGLPIKDDSITEFFAGTPYDYSFSGSLDDIDIGSGKYVYIGYKTGDYGEGDGLVSERPAIAGLTESATVHLVYRLVRTPAVNPPYYEYDQSSPSSAAVVGTYELFGLPCGAAYLERSLDGIDFIPAGGSGEEGKIALLENGLARNTKYFYRTCIESGGEKYVSEASCLVTAPLIENATALLYAEHIAVSAQFAEGLNGQNPVAIEIFVSETEFMPEFPAAQYEGGEEFRAGFTDVLFMSLKQGTHYHIWVRVINEGGDDIFKPVTLPYNFIITQRFVDTDGAELAEYDTVQIIPSDTPIYRYDGYPETIESGGDFYAYAGYKIGETIYAGVPHIPVVTRDETVFLVYQKASAVMSITFPAEWDFYADEKTYPEIETGRAGESGVFYTFVNNSDLPVNVELASVYETHADGLALVPDAALSPPESGEYSLTLIPADPSLTGGENGFTKALRGLIHGGYAPESGSALGTLDGRLIGSAVPSSIYGHVRIGGLYAGRLSAAAKNPKIFLTFSFSLAGINIST